MVVIGLYGAALRGLFIIDPNGIIRHIQINDDSVGRNVDEVIRLITAFQYVESHPDQVCPANWKKVSLMYLFICSFCYRTPYGYSLYFLKGDTTMTPDPDLSKVFFEGDFSRGSK